MSPCSHSDGKSARLELAWTLSRAALAGCLLAGCHAPHGTAPVVPQRPTFSSDTNTAAEGTLEVEAGVALDPGDSSAGLVSVRYGSGPSTEVLADWAPVLVIDRPGSDETGPGDLVLGLRHRIRDEDERASVALQAKIKLPTADEDDGLGSGELDASFAGITTKTVGASTLTGYYQFDVLGDPGGGTAVGHGLALAASRPVADRMGAFVELAATTIPELDSDQVFATLGATYALSDSFVFDAAVALGLSDEAPDAVFLFGVTRNYGRLRRLGE